MRIKDARSLSSAAQEDLRARLIRAVRGRMRQVHAASVNKGSRLHGKPGSKGLTGPKRG